MRRVLVTAAALMVALVAVFLVQSGGIPAPVGRTPVRSVPPETPTATVAVPQPPAPTFSVAGHAYSCGPAGTVALEIDFSYPGPAAHGAFLDGVRVPDRVPVDRTAYSPYFTTTDPIVLPCTARGAHHVRIDVGHPVAPYAGCGMSLSGSPIPGEGVRSGKDTTTITNVWRGDEQTCDVTWTTALP